MRRLFARIPMEKEKRKGHSEECIMYPLDHAVLHLFVYLYIQLNL